MPMPNPADCPVIRAARIIGKPWRLVVVDRLLSGPKTYNQLLKSLPGISSRTLSRILKELQEVGLVVRVCEGVGERNHYALTERGRELGPIIASLRRWSQKWIMGAEVVEG
jgi:DNA-binding HxlR family transcriptional regulator